MTVFSICALAIKYRLDTLAVTPVAYREKNLAVGSALLPMFESHVIELAQLPLVHHGPYRSAARKTVSMTPVDCSGPR